MASQSRATTALLTEHFRFTPLTLIDDIINAVNTIVYRGIEAIETGLLNIPPSTLGFSSTQSHDESDSENTAAADEIEHGVHQLETLLEATVDKAFDKFEIYTLRNILTVPEDVAQWVRLSHYENLTFPSSATPSTPAAEFKSQPTPETLLHLRRQVAETRKLNRALRATHAQNAGLLSDLKTLLVASSSSSSTVSAQPSSTTPSLAFLSQPHHATSSNTNPTTTTTAAATVLTTTTTSPASTPSLTTNAQFIASQLPALRKLVADLRPRLQKMHNVDGNGGVKNATGDWNVKREERRRYIEAGVERVVGRSHHVGGGGEGGGAGAGAERRGLKEVEALEGLVGE